jgi:hypothetical protein
MQTLYALHQGRFQKTTHGSAAVSSSRVFDYGEIEMLLTYAHYLATHNTAHTGGKLTSGNAHLPRASPPGLRRNCRGDLSEKEHPRFPTRHR